MTPNEVTALFSLACETYPMARSETTNSLKTVLRVWRTVLADIPANHAESAFWRYTAEEHEFRPNAGQLRQRALDISNTRQRHALEAWGDVVAAINGEMTISDANAYDPILAEVVDALGWRYLRDGPPSAMTSDRARFCDLYEHLASQQESDRRELPAVKQIRADLAIDSKAKINALVDQITSNTGTPK